MAINPNCLKNAGGPSEVWALCSGMQKGCWEASKCRVIPGCPPNGSERLLDIRGNVHQSQVVLSLQPAQCPQLWSPPKHGFPSPVCGMTAQLSLVEGITDAFCSFLPTAAEGRQLLPSAVAAPRSAVGCVLARRILEAPQLPSWLACFFIIMTSALGNFPSPLKYRQPLCM